MEVCRNNMVTSQRSVRAIFMVMVILVIGIPSCVAQEDESPFQIIQTSRTDNTITLVCRSSVSGLPLPGAFYFLNGTRLDNFITLSKSDPDEKITFMIRRKHEGHFSCGNGSLMSNSVPLIAYPDSMLLSTPPPTHAIIGERVQLNCTIPPGRLIQQYYVTWDRSGTTIYQTRPNNTPQRLNDRYSIDPSDFSLIIDNVELEDGSDDYHCVFNVVDPGPHVMQSHRYNKMQYYNIQLKVFAPPVIDRIQDMYTIIAEGQSASFLCSARGYPPPMITWILIQKGTRSRVIRNDPGIEMYESSSQSGLYNNVTTSQIMITPAEFNLNGEVKVQCNASTTTDSEIDLPSDSTNASLVVLGMFASIDVEITRQLDVLFAINLKVAYGQGVQLLLVYTNVDDPAEDPYNKTTTMAHVNTTVIRHIEFASQIPFERFQVQVGLIYNGVIGPLNNVPDEYEKNQTTLCDQKIELCPNNSIAIGVLAAIIIIVLVIILVIIVLNFVSIYHRRRLNKSVQDNSNDVKSSVNKHTDKRVNELKDNCNDVKNSVDELKEMVQQLLTERQQMETNATNRIQGDGEAHVIETRELIEFDQAFAVFLSETCSMAFKNSQIRDQVKGSIGDTMKELFA